MKLRISFDHDYTLTQNYVQKHAIRLIEVGHDVWVVTSRKGSEYDKSQVKKNAAKVGIPNNKIIFVGGDKWEYFKDLDDEDAFDVHFDDSYFEVSTINANTSTLAVPVSLSLFVDNLIKEYT